MWWFFGVIGCHCFSKVKWDNFSRWEFQNVWYYRRIISQDKSIQSSIVQYWDWTLGCTIYLTLVQCVHVLWPLMSRLPCLKNWRKFSSYSSERRCCLGQLIRGICCTHLLIPGFNVAELDSIVLSDFTIQIYLFIVCFFWYMNGKREFSDTNFEIGILCQHFDWMLQGESNWAFSRNVGKVSISFFKSNTRSVFLTE